MERENIYPKNGEVIEFITSDFKNKKLIHTNYKNKQGLIAFYAPWCPHCQQMKELWIELAIQFKNKFFIGAVNCEKNQLVCRDQKIQYYPTIKYVSKKGVMTEYKGSSQKDEMIFFICEKLF